MNNWQQKINNFFLQNIIIWLWEGTLIGVMVNYSVLLDLYEQIYNLWLAKQYFKTGFIYTHHLTISQLLPKINI